MTKKNLLYLGIFGIVVLVGALFALAPDGVRQGEREDGARAEREGAQAPDPDAPGGEAGPAQPSATAGKDAGLEAFAARSAAPLPPSLEGTEVDGGVRANASGELVIEPQVRLMFEYFLSTLGSASLDEIKVWVAQYLRDELPPKAARQGWRLFGRYLDYRRSLEGLAQPAPDADPARIEAVMNRRNALRREKLGREAAQAFFGAEQAYDQYMLRRRRIEQNDQLTPAEKQRRLEQARAELPEPMREVRAELAEPIRAREKVEQMRANGASEAEVRAWREAKLGAEAADRLEQLEERRAQWEQRYQTYREARGELDTSGLAEPEREAALQRLREKYFEADELRRVEALDRLRAEQAGERPDG